MESKGKNACPRILFAGTASGAGKTTITCAFMRAMQKEKVKISAFKCGPDYIDPMFHREVLGVESGNLDCFFQEKEQMQESLRRHTKDVDLAVIEGVMGYYDGIGFGTEASTAQVAALTDTPVILVVDCKGRALSALAEVYGFVHYRPEGRQIRGVLCNRLPQYLWPAAEQQIRNMGLVPVGYLPEHKEFTLKSRHLGLVTPGEIDGFQEQLDRLADLFVQTVMARTILDIAKEAKDFSAETDNNIKTIEEAELRVPEKEKIRIALAQDEAFCFYYRENTEILQKLGCEIVPFSPLRDEKLPDCDGLILPGGYPELYAENLEKNKLVQKEICDRIENGLPTIAECGGYLYLHERLTNAEGESFRECGLIPAACVYKGFQRQFGYIELTAQKDQLLAKAGDTLKAHEFHYFVSEQTGDAFLAEKPDRSRNWMAAIATDTLYAGFPHIAFSGSPKAAKRFTEAARQYHIKNSIKG